MKKIFTVCMLALATFSLQAQGIVDKYYSDLESQEKTTSIYVSAAMFEMAAKLDIQADDKEFNQIKEFIKSVKSFSLIKVPELVSPISYFKEGIARLDGSHTELVRVKDGDTRLSVYVDEDNDVIYEVAILGVVEGEFLAASLLGEMDMDKISEFINKAQGENFTGLTALRDAGVTNMKVYPNPAAIGSELTVGIPEALMGGMATIYDLNGQQVAQQSANSTSVRFATIGFPAGNYIVELSKGETSIKQKVIVLE